MESDCSPPEDNKIQRFLRENFQLLALIGVFTAIAKYSPGENGNANEVITFLSILSTLLAILLLIIFIVNSFLYVIKSSRGKFDLGFLELCKSSISEIIILIIAILVGLIAFSLIGILAFQYPIQLQLSLIIIELIIGLIIAAIFSLYVVLRVKSLRSSFVAFAIVAITIYVVMYGSGLYSNPHPDIFSTTAHLIGLILILDVLFPVTFINFLYYLYLAGRGS